MKVPRKLLHLSGHPEPVEGFPPFDKAGFDRVSPNGGDRLA